MVFPNKNNLEHIKTELNEFKSKADKAQVQEEYMLKQLNELFECKTIEEGLELLEIFISEKNEYDQQIDSKTNELFKKIKEESLI